MIAFPSEIKTSNAMLRQWRLTDLCLRPVHSIDVDQSPAGIVKNWRQIQPEKRVHLDAHACSLFPRDDQALENLTSLSVPQSTHVKEDESC